MEVNDKTTLVLRVCMFLISLFLIFETVERTPDIDTYTGISCITGLLLIVAIVFACLFSYRKQVSESNTEILL